MKCIRPKYINAFQCDGKSCSSRCCKGWRVTVDNETYQKYCSVEDETQRQDILSKLEPMDNGLFLVKMIDGFKCPFLDDDYLCRLQKYHGEDFLTAICHSYPRVTYKIGDIFEQSLTLTCPLAAKLILLPTAPMEFEEIDIDNPRAVFDWSEKTDLPLNEAINIQLSAISILQDRSLTINSRLLKLCFLLTDETIDDLNLNFKVDEHAKVMVDIFCEMYGTNMDEAKKINLQSVYTKYHESVLTKLMSSYYNIFENYMVNEFFMRCYPYAFDGGLWTNCKIFIIGVKAVEFAIILTAISKSEFITADDFLTMIDAINEKLDHNRNGMKTIRDLAERISNFEDFANLMIDV